MHEVHIPQVRDQCLKRSIVKIKSLVKELSVKNVEENEA